MFSVTLYIVLRNMINSIHQQELGGGCGGNNGKKVVKEAVTILAMWR